MELIPKEKLPDFLVELKKTAERQFSNIDRETMAELYCDLSKEYVRLQKDFHDLKDKWDSVKNLVKEVDSE